MLACDLLIQNARVVDGSGTKAMLADVAVERGRIVAVEPSLDYQGRTSVEAGGHVLAPGFIDVHTHDDLSVILAPQMEAKLSQGVTTVIVGNCGISAAPVYPRKLFPEPMNLLGDAAHFCYPSFAAYIAAVKQARPAVHVAALVGHTALRTNHMDRLDRTATTGEIEAMREQLEEALAGGALGLSTGLAYPAANSASTEEVVVLAQPLAAAKAVCVTHLRSEAEFIVDAMKEAFDIGRRCDVPVIVSHLKCAGVDHWGRSREVLRMLDDARSTQAIGWDCYPYAAGSSTLDLRQVDPRVLITITWSESHPEVSGQSLVEIAQAWGVGQREAASRLQPAGAIYHSISEEDTQRILKHPSTMIGSDGLPCDPRPHPRLWGTFPRVLGRYCRDEGLFSLPQAIHRMTGLSARRFHLDGRGLIRAGYAADLVLFDPEKVRDTATFADPVQPAEGILQVWVSGRLAYAHGRPTGERAGSFLKRGERELVQTPLSEW